MATNRRLIHALGQDADQGSELLDEEILARADATVARLREVFALQWAPATFAEMEQCIAMARRAHGARREHLERLARLAHDMKGQGSTFGFPAVTEMAASLHRLTDDREHAGESELTAMGAHVIAMRDVIENRFADVEGALGRQVIDELRRTVRALLH